MRRRLGRRPALLPPRDRAWRDIAPGFAASLALARGGLPFQMVAARRYDRSGDPRRLARALRAGATVYLPQVHQVLPRLARLMVAVRASLLGPRREECAFLFLAGGGGREGMGLHHDGEVDAFWLQLEGRRTVTLGPPVPRGTPRDLDAAAFRAGGRWATRALAPGTLLYLPPRTPHRVVCRERSLALSLTWSRARPRAASPAARAAALAEWDVVSGWARGAGTSRSVRSGRLYTQVPAVAGPRPGRRAEFSLVLPGGAALRLPLGARPFARRLGAMPALRRADVPRAVLATLVAHGVLAPEDLPLAIVPEDPKALDGWRFA
jgi:hypothetical protein